MTLVRVITRGHFFRKFAFSFQTISDVAWNRPCPVVIYIFDCVSRAMVSGGDLDMVPSSWRKKCFDTLDGSLPQGFVDTVPNGAEFTIRLM